MQDKPGAIQDLETALTLWPVPDNAALEPLATLYRESGNDAGVKALEARVEQLKRLRRY